MTTCPYCAESIEENVEICPYCRSNVNEPLAPPAAPVAGPYDPGDDAAMRMILPVGRSGWAIAAGYLGLFSLILIPAPLALIVSMVAISHLRKNPRLRGMGRAVFGLIMGLLGSAMLLLAIAAAFLA